MTEQLTHSPITKAREAEVDQSYEDLEDVLELTPKQIFFFFLKFYSSLGFGLRK